jgi:hypothetical protein
VRGYVTVAATTYAEYVEAFSAGLILVLRFATPESRVRARTMRIPVALVAPEA